ncbi:hypothetical protein RI543_004794 [Arxiozyma heterogenica]|uniref:Transcription initiation factor TFIID subunit 4 n=1 Tax=Arxiozyma heterogenica TaxID=278026 RepID=A0AAN7ZWW8_9SACH|nr:hypothetical protein RI543_004794 [Kazachstania heterogenica]
MSSNDKNTKIKQEDTTNTISSSTTAAATTTSPTNTATNTTVSNNTSTTAATTTKSSTLPNQDKKPITTTSSSSSTSTTNTKNISNKTQTDPNKMQDVLLSAGVDIREEEALLTGSVTATRNQAKSNSNTGGNTSHNSTTVPPHLPFLHPDQLSKFMKRVSKEHHFDHNYLKNLTKNNGEILNMVSTSCETYMRDIITNALIISRHRRRGVQLNTGRRSEVAIALKSIAQSQKKEEERRLKKRIALGLEKEDLENKVDSEETLHRASNVTAGLRAGSKKQYGWLTASVAKPTTSTIKSAGKIANEIAARGESGLRFREAREEPGIVMRDLLFALENRRNGVHNVITKGYARIRD